MKIAVLLTCHNRREKTLSAVSKNLLEQNLGGHRLISTFS